VTELAMTGSRHATLEITSARGESKTVDSTWVLGAGAATVEDGTVTGFSFDLTYTGFSDHDWDVHLEGTPTAITGTATRDDGLSCTVSGARGALTLAC
jgi:hypothetical protein